MDEQYYCLRLWDYSVPAYVSRSKVYYGTLEDMKAFIEALDADEETREDFRETIAAFRAFEAGNHTVPHNVAYQVFPLLEPVGNLDDAMMKLGPRRWTHINTWGCDYEMRCDSVVLEHLWIDGPEGCCRVMKARFRNLQRQGSDGSWQPLTCGFWGHPKMLYMEDGALCNRLFVPDKTFENTKAAGKDWAFFDTKPDLDFTQFCNEVFGNG